MAGLPAELTRNRVAFVSKVVLSSGDGGNTFSKEEEVRKEDQEGGKEDGPSFFELESAKLRQRDQSLYDQLKANEEKKEEEWKQSHNMFQPPKSLDNEELAFLEEQKVRTQQEQERRKRAEEEELAAFANARASLSVRRLPTEQEKARDSATAEVASGKKPEGSNEAQSDAGSGGALSDEDVVVVRKKRKKKKSKKKSKKKLKANQS